MTVQELINELSKKQMSTELIHIYVGYGDRRSSVKGGKHIGVATNVYSIIAKISDEIFNEITDKTRLIRKLEFTFCDLVNENYESYNLFTDISCVVKEKKTTKTVLDIKSKYGRNSVLKALDLNEKATQKERNQTIGGHRSGEDETN